MSRPIKFRAWHPEEQRMWADVGTDGTGGVILDTEFMGLKPLKGQAYLMQFTGIKDKNGLEIYEGDVIKFPYNRKDVIAPVCWGTDGWWAKRLGWFKELYWVASKCEVIGNIYENPALLKEEQQ